MMGPEQHAECGQSPLKELDTGQAGGLDVAGQAAEKGTMKPDAPSWLIDSIAEASKNASQIYLLYIGFLAYCTLAVFTTTDRQMILKAVTLLPLINLNVPIDLFFTVAPLIALIVFVYLQLYLYRLRSLFNDLRTNDFRIDGRRLYPWIINFAEYPDSGLVGKLQILVVYFSLWWLLPIVLAVFAFRYMKRHDIILSCYLGIIHLFGTIAVVEFLGRQSLQNKIHKYRVPQYMGRVFLRFLIPVLVFELAIILFIILAVKDGKLWVENHSNLNGRPLATLIRDLTTVDLSYQILITEEKDYEELFWLYLEKAHLEGARLSSSILKKANLQNAFLQKADLTKTNLQKADLEGANLNGANLYRAHLEEALLNEASLQNAYLEASHLHGAQLGYTNLSNARLLSADLSGSQLTSGILQGANFTAANFQDALLTAADLEGANLQGASNLTVEQLANVCTLHNSQLDQPLMEQIRSKYPHLLKKPDRNEQGRCVRPYSELIY